jgi:hypothetical protein
MKLTSNSSRGIRFCTRLPNPQASCHSIPAVLRRACRIPAAAEPILYVIDNPQWLDQKSAQVLAAKTTREREIHGFVAFEEDFFYIGIIRLIGSVRRVVCVANAGGWRPAISFAPLTKCLSRWAPNVLAIALAPSWLPGARRPEAYGRHSERSDSPGGSDRRTVGSRPHQRRNCHRALFQYDTVDYHLRSVYWELAVPPRTQLSRRFT